MAPPTAALALLTFTLDDVRYALPCARVVEIVGRVRIVPLPGAPTPVLGLVAYRGALAAAVDLRVRLGHAPRAPAMDDHFVITQGAHRLLVLVVDRAEALLETPAARVVPPTVATPHVTGVAMLDDGLVLIDDLDALLSIDEERALDAALAAQDATA